MPIPHFPTQAVEYLGNFSGEQGCMQVVADTVEWTGNTSMSIDCRAFGMRNVSVLSVVRLSR